jgi:hypothetical protein
MSNTTFVDQTTVVEAEWLNDVNDTVYDILGNGTIIPATKAAARTNLGATSVGDAVFTAVSTDAAQTSLGGTAVGKAVFIAASTTAAKAAIKTGRAGYIDVTSGASLALTNVQQNLAFTSSTASGELSCVNATGVVTVNDGVVALELSGCILLQNNDAVTHEFEIARYTNGSNIYPHGNIKLAAATRVLVPINAVIWLGSGFATTLGFRVRVPTTPAASTCFAAFSQNTNFSGWRD